MSETSGGSLGAQQISMTVRDRAPTGQCLLALAERLNSRLTPLFTALGVRMPSVAANLGTLADGLIGFDAADITAVRDLTSEIRGYPIHFVRDANGGWRIDSM